MCEDSAYFPLSALSHFQQNTRTFANIVHRRLVNIISKINFALGCGKKLRPAELFLLCNLIVYHDQLNFLRGDDN
jgi:hypothetical protein